MKNLLKLGMALLIAAMLFGITGCFEPEDDGTGDPNKPSGKAPTTDFKSYSDNDAAFRVKNGNTSQKLILFKGTLAEENKIGGVPAGAQNHGIEKNSKFFNQTDAFPIIVLTEKQYNANYKDLSAIEHPHTKLFVFFNGSGTNDKVYEISDKLGDGKNVFTIVIPSNTKFNVEIRDGGPSGPPLGYAQSGMLKASIIVQPGKDYDVFPILHRYNNVREMLETIYPVRDDGDAIQVSFNGTTPFEVDLSDVLRSNVSKPNIGAAYVVVVNNASGSQIQISRGGQVIRDTLGVGYFGVGTKVFQIDMPQSTVGEGLTFGGTAKFTGYTIGVTSRMRHIQKRSEYKENSNVYNQNNEFDLENGKQYTINVSGDLIMGNAIAIFEDEEQAVDIVVGQ